MNLLRFVTGSFKEAPTVRDVDVSLLVFDDGIFRNISMVPPYSRNAPIMDYSTELQTFLYICDVRKFSVPTNKLCLMNVETS